jgi:hypothetical protein
MNQYEVLAKTHDLLLVGWMIADPERRGSKSSVNLK